MKRFFHTITGKITLIVCIVLLPIIILMLVVTGFMTNALQEQVLGANENEVALFRSQMDKNLADTVRGRCDTPAPPCPGHSRTGPP